MRHHKIVFILLAIIGAILDIVSKYMVFAAVPGDITKHELTGSIKVIPGILQFGEVINPGIVFGLLPKLGDVFLVVSALAVPIIIVTFVLIKKPTWYSTVSLGLIMAGTLGNLYDRIYFAGVRDFLDFYIIKFPLFNLADSYITLGVAIFSFYLLFLEGREKQTLQNAPNP